MTKASRLVCMAAAKRKAVTTRGCSRCKAGLVPSGFERFWSEDKYEPRRFVFKYTDPRASDVPVSMLALDKTTTPKEIQEALTRCVILCRTCFARFRKDDQCQETTTKDSAVDS